jgi:transposase InsO family protein
LVLHFDNGAPMKSVTLKAKLKALSVAGSRSGLSVSIDKPYAESLLRTLTHSPQWLSQGFKALQTVRNWVQRFATRYNNAHCHSRISFVTPVQRYRGSDKALLAQRKMSNK